MKKSLGILGGMGPLATADLLTKIITMTKAAGDGEHIRIYIDNNPQVPDRAAAVKGTGPSSAPALCEMVENLEACGADCLIMACNTAHYFASAVTNKTKLPFLNMIEIAADVCKRRFPGKAAGLLATIPTIEAGVYDDMFAEKGVPFVKPDQQGREITADVIRKVKGGVTLTAQDRAAMIGVMDKMCRQGAGYFVLGCTELPIAAQQLRLPGQFVDSTAELARAAILFCGYELNE